MVPKIIKKHLLSSRVIKSLKDLTQDLELAYDVSDITPMAIQLRKSYPHFEKGEIYYVWQLSGTVRNGESAGYNKHLIYKIHDKEDIEFAIIELRDVKWCENLDEKFQYHTITYYRKSTSVGNYPYFLPKEDCL